MLIQMSDAKLHCLQYMAHLQLIQALDLLSISPLRVSKLFRRLVLLCHCLAL